MSDVVAHKGRPSPPGGRLGLRGKPQAITFMPAGQPHLELAHGRRHQPTCLGCQDAPCMELDKSDLSGKGANLEEFPQDPSREVCPVEAMAWDRITYGPNIDTDKCIGCGLCAVRCPYGAIGLSDGVAIIQKSDPDAITVPVETQNPSHDVIPRRGALGGPEAPFVRQLPEIAAGLGDLQRSRMTRNMLLACGIRASTRRKGDTNVRMDAILYFSSGRIGVLELETSDAALESPRALLEDIAVLHGRFKVPKENIVPISIVAVLPNLRAEYYQVIDDISSVLQIRCRTLTLGAVCLLMWRFRAVPEFVDEAFTTSVGSVDLGPSLATLDSDFPRREPYPGAYRPAK